MFYRIIAYLIFSRNSGYIFELEALNKKFKYYNLLKFFFGWHNYQYHSRSLHIEKSITLIKVIWNGKKLVFSIKFFLSCRDTKEVIFKIEREDFFETLWICDFSSNRTGLRKWTAFCDEVRDFVECRCCLLCF